MAADSRAPFIVLEARQVLESITDAFFALDDAWRFTYVNSAAEELLGRSREELLGNGIWDVYADAVGSPFWEAYHRARETGETVTFEAHYAPLRADLAVRAYPFEGGLSVYFRDVTEQRRAEARLREEEARADRTGRRLEAVLDVLPVALILMDAEGGITDYNPAAKQIWGERLTIGSGADGYDRYEAYWSGTDRRVQSEEWAVNRALRGESVLSPQEVRVPVAAGEDRYFLNYAVPFRDDEGQVEGAVVALVDVTERVAVQRELAALNAELEGRVAERTRELEHANEALAERNQELHDFAYVASHDLQEPLRKVRAFGDLLQQDFGGDLPETGSYYLERMQDAASRMTRLIHDLLLFSRVVTRGREVQCVALDETIERVRHDLTLRLEETGGELRVESDLPTLEGEPTQLYQLFLNLIGNALKFHREGVPPVVTVRSQVEGDTCRLEVEDNGIGFDEKYLDRIFTPFQRLHERGRYEGTGMGLAICRRVVGRHHGSLSARSTPNEGTTFYITLPLEQPGGRAEEEVQRQAA